MTTNTTTAPAPQRDGALQHKHLIDEELWGRVTTRISRENSIELSHAERMLDGALGFLRLCAANPGDSFTPSKPVDIAWHALILYTKDYTVLCRRLAARYLHHEPSDAPGTSHDGPEGLRRTVAALRRTGWQIDDEIWQIGRLTTGELSLDSQSNCCGTWDCNNGWCNLSGN